MRLRRFVYMCVVVCMSVSCGWILMIYSEVEAIRIR